MKPTIVSRPLGDDPPTAKLYYGQDVRKTLRELPEASVHMVATSPPYWGLRDYEGAEAQLGQERESKDFVQSLVEVFEAVARVLRPDGTVWLNLGDTFRDKQLQGIPWKVAFALQDQGWLLRAWIPWIKRSTFPQNPKDRPNLVSEMVFLLAHPDSGGDYFFDQEAVRVQASTIPQRRRTKFKDHAKSVGYRGFEYDSDLADEPGVSGTQSGTRIVRDTDWWFKSLEAVLDQSRLRDDNHACMIPHPVTLEPLAFYANPIPIRGAHFAPWPPTLVKPMILAGCPRGGTVLDPFSGSGTTGLVALREGRNYVGIDLNESYLELASARIMEKATPAPEVDRVTTSGILDLFGGG